MEPSIHMTKRRIKLKETHVVLGCLLCSRCQRGMQPRYLDYALERISTSNVVTVERYGKMVPSLPMYVHGQTLWLNGTGFKEHHLLREKSGVPAGYSNNSYFIVEEEAYWWENIHALEPKVSCGYFGYCRFREKWPTYEPFMYHGAVNLTPQEWIPLLTTPITPKLTTSYPAAVETFTHVTPYHQTAVFKPLYWFVKGKYHLINDTHNGIPMMFWISISLSKNAQDGLIFFHAKG
ncbi:hypothetical protein DSO57_1033994 [Entomophthora muscae]|uniref:Uncharacterized protein n=1 Tax=Entomophthora muscae TaxID=34485 RepID=A0ACC2TAL8_9FUNG|nr:hypothetical protein DSO57_1033994 [Entomophthora muscae]